MASLTGQTISSTYDGLLKTSDNDVLTADGKEITDGLGNGSGVSLDTNGNIVAQGTVKAIGGVRDTSNDLGTSGQVLSSTGSGTNWIDVSSAVDSVNGQTGAVVLNIDNITDEGSTTTNAITVGGLHVNSTGAVEMPTGTDAQRPTAVAGMLRFNTDTNGFEGYDGTEWGAIGGSSGSEINIDNFSGNGSTTVFNLSQSVDNENVTQVYIDGVYQQKNTYSVVGAAITFSEAPPTGTNNVEVASFTTVQVDNIADDIVTYAKLATEFTTSSAIAASTIDFAAAQVFTKTLSTNTTFSITNAQIGMVKDLYLTGDFTFSITNGKLIAGTYDGTVTNFIQIVAQTSSSFWYSISQEQA